MTVIYSKFINAINMRKENLAPKEERGGGDYYWFAFLLICLSSLFLGDFGFVEGGYCVCVCASFVDISFVFAFY